MNHSNPTPDEEDMMFGSWEKLGENSDGKLAIFFLKISNGEREGRNRRREKTKPTNGVRPRHPLAVGGVWPTRGQRSLKAVGPTATHTAWAVFSRAPLVLQPVSWASELRYWIRFRITNRDSLTHDDDYTTLKNGWEIISEIIDEVNSTNKNEK